MKYQKAFALFEKMIDTAEKELFLFTTSHPFQEGIKNDNSLVTSCDKRIDQILSHIALDAGLHVISEEGEHTQKIVAGGNYITIDPIDGTLGYIDYVCNAFSQNNIANFLGKDLGPKHDFCLLLGIVEDGVPAYGAVYNYVTHEKILIDGYDRNNFIRENNARGYTGDFALYSDQRGGGEIEQMISNMPNITNIVQANLGLKSVYTIINPHKAAITPHQIQGAGIWDLTPAATAARVFGGDIFDVCGEKLQLTSYITLPKKGAVIIKGKEFAFAVDLLKKHE